MLHEKTLNSQKFIISLFVNRSKWIFGLVPILKLLHAKYETQQSFFPQIYRWQLLPSSSGVLVRRDFFSPTPKREVSPINGSGKAEDVRNSGRANICRLNSAVPRPQIRFVCILIGLVVGRRRVDTCQARARIQQPYLCRLINWHRPFSLPKYRRNPGRSRRGGGIYDWMRACIIVQHKSFRSDT